ncbi:MAG: exodeoxyribonuclease VII small subunit [Ignavibacteriae bacterium]|nr:exodeoxyribonuclease VII small subunit [Ignavibacteriota bacterium]
MPKKKADQNSFEYSYKRLEEILEKLENQEEENSLEDILNYYQEGLKLLKICRHKLSEAELKIEKINTEELK